MERRLLDMDLGPTVPEHDQWVVSFKLYAKLAEPAVLAGGIRTLPYPTKTKSGITIVPDMWVGDRWVHLMRDGKLVGSIYLEPPYNVDEVLQNHWDGGDTVVWS